MEISIPLSKIYAFPNCNLQILHKKNYFSTLDYFQLACPSQYQEHQWDNFGSWSFLRVYCCFLGQNGLKFATSLTLTGTLQKAHFSISFNVFKTWVSTRYKNHAFCKQFITFCCDVRIKRILKGFLRFWDSYVLTLCFHCWDLQYPQRLKKTHILPFHLKM